MSNTILRIYKTHVKKQARKVSRLAKNKKDSDFLKSENTKKDKTQLEKESTEYNSFADKTAFSHNKKHNSLAKPNYTDEDPLNAFAYMPEKLLHPSQEATIQEIKIYNFGFREKRQLVSKPDTLETDFETVPEEYFEKSGAKLNPEDLIEGDYFKTPGRGCTG